MKIREVFGGYVLPVVFIVALILCDFMFICQDLSYTDDPMWLRYIVVAGIVSSTILAVLFSTLYVKMLLETDKDEDC